MPEVIINILEKSGYDSTIAIESMNVNQIEEMEGYVSRNLQLLDNSIYTNTANFKFLPGHKTLLLTLPKYTEKFSKLLDFFNENFADMSSTSFIMKELMKVSKQNHQKDSNNHRYLETVRYFAIYLYIMSGRACYEVLCNNFPLPQPSTVCKF